MVDPIPNQDEVSVSAALLFVLLFRQAKEGETQGWRDKEGVMRRRLQREKKIFFLIDIED